MLRPLNKASLGYCVLDRCVLTLDRVKHATSRPPMPNGSVGRLAGFPYAPDQVYWIGTLPSDAAQPTHWTQPLKRAAVGSRVSLRSFKSKGWDGSVRGKLAKGHFVQGMQHPRIFGWGHIGRGWTNIAPLGLFNVIHFTVHSFTPYVNSHSRSDDLSLDDSCVVWRYMSMYACILILYKYRSEVTQYIQADLAYTYIWTLSDKD
jgi:hypothetical protein